MAEWMDAEPMDIMDPNMLARLLRLLAGGELEFVVEMIELRDVSELRDRMLPPKLIMEDRGDGPFEGAGEPPIKDEEGDADIPAPP
jgi:hypothetical protein